MSELENILMCVLMIFYSAVIYSAGKSDFFNVLPKIFAERLKEVTRKNGEWFVLESHTEVTFICSECKFSFTEADPKRKCEYSYCPICGAKMKGGA